MTTGLILHLVAILGSLSLRAAVVLGTAAVACGVLRHRAAALRHAVWCAALVAVVLLPTLDRVTPAIGIRMPAGRAAAAPRAAVRELPGPTARGVRVGAGPAPWQPRLPDPRTFIAIAWLAGVAIATLRLARSQAAVAGIVRRSQPAPGTEWEPAARDAARAIGLARPIALRISADVASPIVAGVRSPCVILPVASAHWDAASRHRVLLHEMAHVQRHDLAWHWVSRALAAAAWFHPLVRFACGRVHAEAERACDDTVLRAGERPSTYAAMLLRMAAPTRPSASMAIAMFRREQLSERIDAIVATRRDRVGLGPRAVPAFMACAVLLATLAAAPRIESAAMATPAGVRSLRVGAAGSPVRISWARVRETIEQPAGTPAAERVRLDGLEAGVENASARAVRAVRVRVHTPGATTDAMWRDLAIDAHGTAVLRIARSDWANILTRGQVARCEASVVDAWFAGDPDPRPRDERVAPSAPDGRPEAVTPPPFAPRAAAEPQAPAEPAPGARVEAQVLNPRDAPVTIERAWTPREVPAPSSDAAVRAFDRGHAITWTPAFDLRNASGRRVLAVRMRYKADAASHAVTVVEREIAPGATLHVGPGSTMWGTADAMRVQVLGVQFAEGGTWGSLDSTLDTGQGWIR